LVRVTRRVVRNQIEPETQLCIELRGTHGPRLRTASEETDAPAQTVRTSGPKRNWCTSPIHRISLADTTPKCSARRTTGNNQRIRPWPSQRDSRLVSFSRRTGLVPHSLAALALPSPAFKPPDLSSCCLSTPLALDSPSPPVPCGVPGIWGGL
jgi:hypothetical protein